MQKLLDTEPLDPSVCHWADRDASAQNARRKEHYVNLPRELSGLRSVDCPLASPCILSALAGDHSILADRSRSRTTRALALRYFIHWVGDIHTPLHVSFADDRGGNLINVDGPELCGKKLHQIWDTCLVYAAKRELKTRGVVSFSHALIAKFDPKLGEIVTSEPYFSPMLWANESFAIATAPTTAYCIQGSKACAYSRDDIYVTTGQARRRLKVDQAYLDANAHRVALRLYLAGSRLARVLDQVFSTRQ